MKALVKLVEAEPQDEWKPKTDFGRALKEQEALLTDLVNKGHGDKAIFEAWGLEGSGEFAKFRSAMRGLRDFIKRS